MAPGPGNPELRWTVEEIKETPSRADGVPERSERAERFVACDYARSLIRQIFTGNDRQQEDNSSRAQLLACYYLQLFFMFRSLRQEDAKTVAVAASFLACKVVDLPRKIRNVLRSLNQLRVQLGEQELGEEDQKELGDRVLKIEFALLRIIRFEFDVVLPLDGIATLTEAMLVQLAQCEVFRHACRLPPQLEAQNLRNQLLTTAAPFMLDSFMGFAPLLARPRVIAAGALVIATRYIRREIPIPDLCSLLHVADPTLPEEEIRIVVEEILNVFRTKPCAAAARAAAAPAAPGGAAGAG